MNVKSRKGLIAGGLLAVSLLALTACTGSTGGGAGSSVAPSDVTRTEGPDFTIPVVRASGMQSFTTAEFTLSERKAGPLVLYFSFVG